MAPCCRPRRGQSAQDYGLWQPDVPTCRVCADSIRQGYQLAHGVRARSCLFRDSRSVEVRTRDDLEPDVLLDSNDLFSLTHQFNAAIALARPLGLLRLLWPDSNLSSHGFRGQGLGVLDAVGVGGQSCDLIVLDLEHLGGLRILGVRIGKGGICQRTALPLGLWLLC